MKSRKKLLCLAVAASLVMGAAFTGCTVTIDEADVKQTVVTVNISKADEFSKEFAGYESVITDKVFVKRDMLTAFYNTYSSYTQMGYSYSAVYDMIKDSLVSNAVTTQYATVYLLKSAVEDDTKDATLAAYNACETEAEKYEYLLGQYDATAIASAKYALQSTLNSVLDSSERDILKDEKEDDKYTGSGTRSTPTGIDSTVEEYVPEGYNVYTGYEHYELKDMQTAIDNGDYEPLYGTTAVSRQKAYARFLKSLDSNYLLTKEDARCTDIWELSYVQESYVSQLQSEVISAFQDKITEEQETKITTVEGDVYTYIKAQYDSLLEVQTAENDSASAFESAMGSMSDSKFVLYSPKTVNDTEEQNGTFGTFGYVYNILLPFSSVQSQKLTGLQTARDDEIISESEYFFERNKLLKNIQTTDQRSAWFNGATDYSFDVTKYNADKEVADKLGYYAHTRKDGDESHDYLFFENNVTDTEHGQYEALEKYDGRYSYNGTVKENTDGSYTLIPNKLTIDDMLYEFEAYINYVLTGNPVGNKVTYTIEADPEYYGNKTFTQGEEKEIDYKKLVYAMGKVNLGENANRENMFVADKEHITDRYKVMAAVNELQYAYTTDTGVLSQYIGYTVSAYDTSYIKEFEYAAQQAIRQGAGTFAVCAGDYGWHLIYVTETFDTAGGAVYTPDFTKDRVEKKGTFENRFYNWIKDSHLSNEVTLKSNAVAKNYNTDKAVTVNKDAYKDLSES